ncbi:MAG: hypothetical protein J7M21_03695 [Planctomycetes bacterium]|nr:hypothetical protein [Planctomycetota bacterium]
MMRQAEVQLPGRLTAVTVVGVTGGRSRARADRRVRPAEGDRQRDAQEQAYLAEARRRVEAERARLEQARRALVEAAGELRRFQEDLQAEAEQQLLELAVEIARKVINQEIQAGRCDVAPIVAEALGQVPSRSGAVVHLNPGDYAASGLAEQLAAEGLDVSVRPDPDVPPGGCVIETPEGRIESTVESKLAEIADALRQPE